MRADTRRRVDAIWAARFSLAVDERPTPGVTISTISANPACVTVSGSPVAPHVRCPAWLSHDEAPALAALTPQAAWKGETWIELLGERSTGVSGPCTYFFADDATKLPPQDGRVQEVTVGERRSSPQECASDDGDRAGFSGAEVRVFGLSVADDLLAAATLKRARDGVMEIGIAPATGRRRPRFDMAVVSAATRVAIAEDGFACWRAPRSDEVAHRLAARLGFDPYGDELVVPIDHDVRIPDPTLVSRVGLRSMAQMINATSDVWALFR